MSRRRIQNVLRKEWTVMLTDPNRALFVTLLPVLIVGQIMLVIWLIVEFGGEGATSVAVFVASLAKLNSALPSVAALPLVEQFQVLLLSQLGLYLLLIPTMIAMSFASFSIVEEKLSRSLEPLLATPVRTWELLLGKALSGALPAVLVTWVCGGLVILGVVGLGWGHLLRWVMTPSWYLSLFLLNPTIALLGFLLGIVGSSRAKDASSAQNIALVIVLPVLILIAVQVTGLVWFTPLLTALLALAVAALDVLVLRVAIGLFQRESIVVHWR